MVESDLLNGDIPEHELNSEDDNNLEMQTSLDDQTKASVSNTSMDQEECTNKRIRHEEEQTEKWEKAVKKSKKRNIPNMDSTSGQAKSLTEICITCKNALPKRFALSKLFRDHDVANVSKVKYINPFKVLVQFDKEESAERFLLNKVFVEKYGWRSLRTYEVGLSYGIVRDIDLGLEEKEIMENMISDVEIVSIKRLNKRNTEESGWVESELKFIIHHHCLPLIKISENHDECGGV
ncbi:uncharacterized protein LOC125225552 [Leguminivora glycinivorella]|uniref:uncharacterized protein LOC125225552 n=1 Tax=Leguminivora glycinivorella TaxID=1035111 RepID=UPI00200E3421|nr:uncharacterized protein LOC125225552 [Leguminivora glycinivorella]